MSNHKFAETHNLVAFLEKPEESSRFEEIIDFLNASYVLYALTVNPTIYTTCIEQFWASAMAKILDDAKGIDCLPTAIIFVELERMSGPTEPVTAEAHKVLDLEKAKTTQAKEIASLKKRVKKLEKRRKLRTPRLKRLRKVGSTSRVKSSNDVSLGDREDASKQGRKIVDLDADAEEIKFEKVVEEPVVSVATTTKLIPISVADPVTTTSEVVTTTSASVEIPNELTLAQTLIEIKTAKPKYNTPIFTYSSGS
ncbi:hypothetical protein Tco_1390959 [Tanacetum coccineum]